MILVMITQLFIYIIISFSEIEKTIPTQECFLFLYANLSGTIKMQMYRAPKWQ